MTSLSRAGSTYPIHEMEWAALAALEKVLTCSESVAEALAVHREGLGAARLTPDEVRGRLRDLDADLLHLKGEEQSAVAALLAGIRGVHRRRPTQRCLQTSPRGART